MAYTDRTATTGDPIDLTFVKLIDYPAITDSQFGVSTPGFIQGHNNQINNNGGPNTFTSNMPALFTSAYDTGDGETLQGITAMGVAHADYAIRTAGDLAGDNVGHYQKQGYIDHLSAGLNFIFTPAAALSVLGQDGYEADVAIDFQRQVMGDFTGDVHSPITIVPAESQTMTFEDYVQTFYTSMVCPTLASTTAAPEALFVSCINYWEGSSEEQDRVGGFVMGTAGDIALKGLWKTDTGDNRNTTVLAECRDATHHYFVHKFGQDELDVTTWGCVTVCGEADWPTIPTYTNYTAKFDDPDLPASLGELLTDSDPDYKFTALYGTDLGFLISYKKNETGAWNPKFVLVDRGWTTVQHIVATAGDATAETVLTQGIGTTNENGISLTTDAGYYWMIGGTPDVPLIVEAGNGSGGSGDEGSDAELTTRCWGFSLDDHDYYVLPSVGLVYDLKTNQWSEWLNENLTRLRACVGQNWIGMTGTLSTFNTDIVAGDDTTGVLWIFDPSTARDDKPTTGDEAFTRIVTSMVAMNGRDVVPCNAVTLTVALGDPSQTGASITLRTSDDLGKTWISHGSVDLVAGAFDQVVEWYGLGLIRAPGRIFQFSDNGATVRYGRCDMR